MKHFEFTDGILHPVGKETEQQIPLAVISTPMELHEVYPSANESMHDDLVELFAKHEVPVGLIRKLTLLENYELVFILDDSGSMSSATTVSIQSEFMRAYIARDIRRNGSRYRSFTRWDEQQDRVHLLLDFLCYIRTGKITITFLNRQDRIVLPARTADTDLVYWLEDAHHRVSLAFVYWPAGSTPIFHCLQRAFVQSGTVPTAIYLFTDGQPDPSSTSVSRLIENRLNPETTPLTLISCTDDDSAVAWMKDVDGRARNVAEVDDFLTERKEVRRRQGKMFPFTYGLWIICQLTAVLDPKGLDILDEREPLSQFALSVILGRDITAEEHALYLQHHPSRQPVTECCVIS
jgi:hypothetical protein